MTNTVQLSENDPSIDAVVVRARRDREAFGSLYDAIYPCIFRYCLRRSAEPALAEDITSNVFINVANNIREFAGSTYEDFRRWVFTIATNEINATYRKSTRRKALLVDAAHSGALRSESTQNEARGNLVEADGLQQAILRLDQRSQAIITMRYFSDLPYEDIGEILNITPGAARTAASRAIQKIRSEMGS